MRIYQCFKRGLVRVRVFLRNKVSLKSLFYRSFIRLLLVSFIFQTLYPSVAFAILMVDARVYSEGNGRRLGLKIVEYDGDDLSFRGWSAGLPESGLPEAVLSDRGASDAGSSMASTSPYRPHFGKRFQKPRVLHLPLDSPAASPSGSGLSGADPSVPDRSVPLSPLASMASTPAPSVSSTRGISDPDVDGSEVDLSEPDLSDTESIVSRVPSDRSIRTTASQAAARVLIERHIDLADRSVLSGSCLYHDLSKTEAGLIWQYKGLEIGIDHDGCVSISGTYEDQDSALSVSGTRVQLVDAIVQRLEAYTSHLQLLGEQTSVRIIHNLGETLIQGEKQHALESLIAQDGVTTLQGDFTIDRLEGDVVNQGALSFLRGQGTLTNQAQVIIKDGGHYQGRISNTNILTAEGQATLEEGLENQESGVATFSKDLDATLSRLVNNGTLTVQGDVSGNIESLTGSGLLTIGSVADLRVRDFVSTGELEVLGPMTWTGERFQSSKTTFRGKAHLTAAVVETSGPLMAESDLSVTGQWIHQSGKAQVSDLTFNGPSLTTEAGSALTVTGSSKVEADHVHNKGDIILEGPLRGRIGEVLNQGGMIIKKDVHLTGERIINEGDFEVHAVFDWVGQTLDNRATGRMALFDNQVVATRQVINQGLMLWTHNTFRTEHFLNLGWSEMTRNLLTSALPDDWIAPTDVSTTFKESTVENRGVLRLSPSDYTPRMTIVSKRPFEHWLNTGQMHLGQIDMQAKTFSNDGELMVSGPLTGHIDVFENIGKALFKGPVHLTGKTFSTTGVLTFAEATTLKMDSLSTGGEFISGDTFTLDAVDWTGLEDASVDIARLLWNGKSIVNEGSIIIRELLGGSTRIALLHNRQASHPHNKDKKPLFRIIKGSASLAKLINGGTVVLEGGRYSFADLTGNSGVLEVETFLPEGSGPFQLHGTIRTQSISLSSFFGSKLINRGQTTFGTASFTLAALENAYGAVLTLLGYGTANIGALDNRGTISLNDRATLVAKTLKGDGGVVESSQNNLRILLLERGKAPQSESYYPTLKLGEEYGPFSDIGKFKAKGDLLMEIDDSSNLAAYLHLLGEKLQCGGILRLYGDTFWARWDDTYPGAVHLKVKQFDNPGRHLIFRSLKIEADKFANGQSNTELGYLETQPDTKKAAADTSLEIIVRGDADNRYGQVFGHGPTTIRSLEGDVLVGSNVTETRCTPPNFWRPGYAVQYLYQKPNGSFVSSNRDIILDGKDVLLRLAEVETEGGRLRLVAKRQVRSLASKVFAKSGITIDGVRFDNEIFETFFSNGVLTTPHESQRQLFYQHFCHFQQSAPSFLESLGDIRFNTQVTRNYGSVILAAGSLIDDKSTRWQGATNDCPFIEYVNQVGTHQYIESDRDRGWSRPLPAGYLPVNVLAQGQAGKHVRLSARSIRNSGFLSGVTVELSAAQSVFQHLGHAAQEALQTLMEMGVLSVKTVVVPDISTHGLVRQQPDGAVRKMGTRLRARPHLALERLPILGQRHLGAPPHTKMYMHVSFEMEKLQRMMAYTMGRVYDQGLSGEDVYEEYVQEGQRQAQAGALVDIRGNRSQKAFLAWALEKAKHTQTNEEGLIAVLNLFVPESLRHQGQSGEARAQQHLKVTTGGDLTLEGAHLKSEERDVQIRVGGNLEATAAMSTTSKENGWQQTAVSTQIQAPQGSVAVKAEEAVAVSGIKVLAEKGVEISGKTFTDQATRLQSHAFEYHNRTRTTTDIVTHDVSEYTVTGTGGVLNLSAHEGTLSMQAPKLVLGENVTAHLIGRYGVVQSAVQDSHTTHTETTVKKRGTCGMGGSSKTTTTETLLTHSRGPVVESYTPHTNATVTYAAPEGSILLQQLTLGQNVLARLMAGGDIYFKAGESTFFKATLTKKEGMVWNSTTQDQEGHTIPQSMTLGEGAAIEIIAANTLHLEALQRDISALSQRITKPADVPLILSELQEHHQQDHHQIKSLSKSMTTLVTLATTAVLAITGAGAAVAAWASQLAASASLAATVIGATSQAMLANLCSRTMNALIETGANIGQTLKATASSEAMKSLLKTGIRAGAIAGVTTGLGIAGPKDLGKNATVSEAFAPDRILHHLQYQGFTQAVGCSVDAIMGDRHAFHHFGANVAAGTVGAVGAGAIGCAYSKGLMDAVSHKVIHAGVGALSGAIVSGKDGAISGAMGAIVSETYADMFKPEGLLEKITAQESALGRRLTATEFAALNSEHTKDITKTAEIAKVIAAASVFAVGGDVQVAHLTACSAIDHNFLPTAFALASLGYTSWCGYEIYSAYEEGGAIAALKQLGIEVAITATGAAAGKVIYKVGSIVYPTAELAVNAILSKNPMLKAVIGSLTDKITSSINALNASTLGQAFAKSDAFVMKMGERVRGQVGLGTTKESAKKTVKFADEAQQPVHPRNWVRDPSSIQDQMVLAAAKRGEGEVVIGGLTDPKFLGMDKMRLKCKSDLGRDSVVHYVRDPKTGELLDFKFKKRSID